MMDSFEQELEHDIIQVMIHDVCPENIFEQACWTTLIACGPPPPSPNDPGMSWVKLGANALNERNDWLAQAEHIVTRRYNINAIMFGDFIVAFTTWWKIQQTEEELDETRQPTKAT